MRRALLCATALVSACTSDSLGPTMPAADQSPVFSVVDLATSPDLAVDLCQDNIRDGSETDVDCGGPTCRGCDDGLACNQSSDCVNRNCVKGTCRPVPPCQNGIKDGEESDVDCGGPVCAHCPAGSRCRADNDCATGLCRSSLCVGPTPLALSFGAPAMYPTSIHPRSLAVGDFDRDGNLDLAAPGETQVTAFRGRGNGTFVATAMVSTDGTYEIATADFDLDGKLDLAVDYGPNGVGVLLGNGDATFRDPIRSPVPNATFQAFVVGDLDGDGAPDIFKSDWGSGTQVLLGDGQGRFKILRSWDDATMPASRGAMADVDNDGNRDLLLANGDGLAVWLGDGKGGFAKPVHRLWAGGGTGAFSSIAVYDLRRNLTLDVVDSYGSVLLGKGDGTFALPSQFPGGTIGLRGLAIADFDRDGRADLATGDRQTGKLQILAGTGGGSFKAAVEFPAGASTQTVAAADFNHDDKPDIVISDYSAGQLVVLLNASR